MNKSNFKKLALMGMVCGAVLATQAPVVASEGVSMNATMSGHNGCGSGSCGSKSTSRGYTADATTEVNSATGRKVWSESDLLNSPALTDSSKATFRGLSPEGKALALKLASSDQYKDKNDAIREAARQTTGKPSTTAVKNY